MVPTEQGQYLEVVCTATCQCLLSICGNIPGKGSVFMRSLLLVHMSCGVSEGGIGESTKEVCRNLIKSIPRGMEAMIKAKECQTKCKPKNCPI